MQIELIGGDYGGQVTPNFFDPGQGGGGIEMGWAADYVQEAYSPSAKLRITDAKLKRRQLGE